MTAPSFALPYWGRITYATVGEPGWRRAMLALLMPIRMISAVWDTRVEGVERGCRKVSTFRRHPRDEAQRVGDEIGVDWSRFDLEQFRVGMDVEYEHGSHDPQTDVTHDDPILTGKIALAHMNEYPDYYERLERMEAVAARDWAAKPS